MTSPFSLHRKSEPPQAAGIDRVAAPRAEVPSHLTTGQQPGSTSSP